MRKKKEKRNVRHWTHLLRGDEARRFTLFVLDIEFSACIHKSLHTRVMAVVGSLMVKLATNTG
jgi:hypothetical protein